MNKFLEEKEKLLNIIENNTPKHWEEYYKDVPIDCIFEDLVIDINEIKRLTKENQQLKGSLQTYEILLKANVEENQQLKEDILFCLKSIEQEMEMSTDSRTRQEMLSCYQILNEWSDNK